MVELDGSYLEGGGQILRTAVGLSAVTGRPCRVFNVRKGRKNPGLRAQHLRGIEALASLCGAELSGAQLSSPEIQFRPGELAPEGSLSVHIGTAGAVTLVLQALMIPLVRSPRPVTIEITGGTHVRWAPVADYCENVFAHCLQQMGCTLGVKVERYGFYPKGGGKVSVTVEPGELHAVNWRCRGAFEGNEVCSFATEDLKKARVAERQIEGAHKLLEFEEERVCYVASPSTGSSVFALARYENCVLGASALGERGKPAEKIGRESARALSEQVRTDACLDEHMADQILPYMALVEEDSTVSVAAITDHCRTSIWVIEKFLPVQFDFDEERRTITCRHA